MPFMLKMSFITIIFGISLVFYSYVFSFWFSKSNAAFKQFSLYNLFLNYTVWFILIGSFSEYEYPSYAIELGYCLLSPFMLL